MRGVKTPDDRAAARPGEKYGPRATHEAVSRTSVLLIQRSALWEGRGGTPWKTAAAGRHYKTSKPRNAINTTSTNSINIMNIEKYILIYN